MMAFALLESLTVTGILVLLGALLPSKWLRDGFALKGFVTLVVFSITSIVFQNFLENYPSATILTLAVVIPLSIVVLLLFVIRSFPKLQAILLNIEDRVLIMLFLYIPIGILSLVVVVYQNLL
jgi:hypothetical protein